eukprot:jgi/Chrzof1/1418/Cz10g07090.t1
MATLARQVYSHCQQVVSERLSWTSTELMVSVMPVIFYWLVALYFEVLDHLQLPWFEKYRLRSQQEADKKNITSRKHVALRVLLQNAIQIVVGLLMIFIDPGFCDSKPYRGLIPAVGEFVVAMLVLDAWQYFIHRWMHQSKYLYNNIHSHHHRLLVCYAYGALYNHPLEALLLDTVGGVVTYYASGISCKTSVVFFTFATVKTVLDHSGYRFPVNLLHDVFPNSASYHDVHHDLRGFRKNYSQPFFSHWDRLLGTYMDPQELQQSSKSNKQK